MKTAIDAGLQKIIEDNSSGSKEILSNLNKYFLEKGISNIAEPEESLEYLQQRFKDFTAIQNYLQKLLDFVKKNEFAEAENLIHSFEECETSKLHNIYSSLKPHLSGVNSIVTISNSFTLLQIFTMLNRDVENLSIAVSEARPNLEGRILAEKLAQAGIKIEMITEAMIPCLHQEVRRRGDWS